MRKKIVIDCRYFGKSGIGQVNKGILDSIGDFSNFVFLGDKSKLGIYYPSVEIINDTSNPFSKKGIILSRGITKIINSNLCFLTPAYIVPFGIKVPIYTNVLDCLFFDEKETNNGYFDFLIKKEIYKRAIRKSKKIFTISNFSKERIKSIFKCKKEVIVLRLGLSKDIIEYKKKHFQKMQKENSIIFVGNIKKHKGLDTLISAFKIAREKDKYLKLYIIGNVDGLRTTLNLDNNLEKENIFIKKGINNETMFELISKCKYLVQPSRYEGMGLPPLEALYLETNVILNDLQVFHEFYDNNLNVTYFKLNDSKDLANKILETKDYVLDDSFFSNFDYKNSVNKIFKIISK